MKRYLISCLATLLLILINSADCALLLRENLQKAQPGDFIVAAQGKNFSLINILDKQPGKLTIEEISIPAAKIPRRQFSWKNWVMQGSPGCTSHVTYTIDPSTGQMLNFFIQRHGRWYEASPQSNFLSTLLNLQFHLISPDQRRRVGGVLSSNRPFWQPKLIVEGQTIDGVEFNAWKTSWPKDGSDLAGKTIEVYLPLEGSGYPSYFPYWLQISGGIGNAKIRIVDSGTGLTSMHSLPYSTKSL